MAFDFPFFFAFVFSPPVSLLYGLITTVVVTAASMVLGIGLGIPLAVAGMSSFRPLRILNQAYISFFRGTPVLLQIMLVYFGAPIVLGFDPFGTMQLIRGISFNGAILAGILAFALHEAAYMSEITRAGILSIDCGQSEAAKALGMEPKMVMRRIILPQAIRVIVPPLGNQCNAMFKTTSLLSVIAVPELFLVADSIHASTYRTFEVYLGVSVYYLVLTVLWGVFQRWLEHRMNRGYAQDASQAKQTLKTVPIGEND